MSLFIVVEGIDGSGKGEQIKKLKEWLNSQKVNVLVTREPSKGKYGKEIRKILQSEKDPFSSKESLLQLYVQDREDHLNKEIEPFLKKDSVVICDRYYYSTIVYQSAQGMPVEEIILLNQEFRTPDLVLVLDLPAETALERIGKARKIEKFEKLEFMKKLREGFLGLKNVLDENIKIIDASKPIEEVFEQIKREVKALL